MSGHKSFFSNFLQWPGFIFWLVGISMINWAFAEEPPEDVKAIFGFIFLFVGGGVWWTGILLVKKPHGKTWHELAELFGATAFLIGIGGFAMRMVDKPGRVGGFFGSGLLFLLATTVTFILLHLLIRRMKKDFGDLSFGSALKNVWIEMKSGKGK